MNPLVIRTQPAIAVQIDDDVVRFVGDPDIGSLVAFVEWFAGMQTGDTVAAMRHTAGALDQLRALTVPDDLDTFDAIVAARKFSTGVTLQILTHLMEVYGQALGFPVPSSPRSSAGPSSSNLPTSPE